MTGRQPVDAAALFVSTAVPQRFTPAISGIVSAPSTRVTGEAHGRTMQMLRFGGTRPRASMPPERSP